MLCLNKSTTMKNYSRLRDFYTHFRLSMVTHEKQVLCFVLVLQNLDSLRRQHITDSKMAEKNQNLLRQAGLQLVAGGSAGK